MGDTNKKDVSLRKGVTTIPVVQYRNGKVSNADDRVIVEEPLEIFLDDQPYTLTMRLPGEEIQLALGYCFSERIIDSMNDVNLVNFCKEDNGNRVTITLNPKRRVEKDAILKKRRLPVFSSCGLCGKDLIEDIRTEIHVRENSFTLSGSRINELIEVLESRQEVFSATRGAHSAAIFNKDYTLLAFSEDIGRHNALDKAIGKLVYEGKTKEAMIVVLTSRLSYEMVQKTSRLGAEILIGFSAPTSLAIELAKNINLTLIGFSKKESGKIYTAPERILF